MGKRGSTSIKLGQLAFSAERNEHGSFVNVSLKQPEGTKRIGHFELSNAGSGVAQLFDFAPTSAVDERLKAELSGRRLGTIVLRRALSEARRLGAREVYLIPLVGSMGFYKKSGFAPRRGKPAWTLWKIIR